MAKPPIPNRHKEDPGSGTDLTVMSKPAGIVNETQSWGSVPSGGKPATVPMTEFNPGVSVNAVGAALLLDRSPETASSKMMAFAGAAASNAQTAAENKLFFVTGV